MAMRYITATIEGVTSLLQHRFADESEVEHDTRRIAVDRGLPREQAEKSAYRNPDDGTLYLPGAAIARLLREAGGQHKQRGSRKSVKYVVPAAVVVLDDLIRLHNPDTGEALRDFEVDSRPVVIPATKGRVMRHRPRLDHWAATFRLRVNDSVLPEETIHQLLTEGGEQIGVGDFRPEKGGAFGVFRVTLFARERGIADAAAELAASAVV